MRSKHLIYVFVHVSSEGRKCDFFVRLNDDRRRRSCIFQVILCSPNEGFGSLNKALRGRFLKHFSRVWALDLGYEPLKIRSKTHTQPMWETTMARLTQAGLGGYLTTLKAYSPVRFLR
jgi:hypothetical protein